MEAGGDLNVTTPGVLNNSGGVLAAGGALNLRAQSVINDQNGQVLATGPLHIVAEESIRNSTGTLSSLGDGLIESTRGSFQNQSGTVISEGTLQVRTTDLDNTQGTLTAGRDATLTVAQGLNNTGGAIIAQRGDLNVETPGALLINTAGQLHAAGAVTLRAGQLTNQNGVIASGGNQSITVSGALDNTQSRLATNASSTLHTATLNNAGGEVLALADLNLTATQSMDNRTGRLASNGTELDARDVVLTAPPLLTLPRNAKFQIQPAPQARYLVETDPRFVRFDLFISSDYFFDQLARDPVRNLKRYGDGYTEQRLIADQIFALTGRQYLSGYTDTQTEYAALMDAGVAFAEDYQLTPGVTLTAEQVANLTTDIVWLTTQTVTLANGESQDVLVPQVYLRRPQGADLQPSGALIAARGGVFRRHRPTRI